MTPLVLAHVCKIIMSLAFVSGIIIMLTVLGAPIIELLNFMAFRLSSKNKLSFLLLRFLDCEVHVCICMFIH